MSDAVAIDQLVVLLGHENSRNGELSRDALSRIGVVEDLLRLRASEGNVALVATGGFGGHFNVSNYPHGKLLIQEMKRRGIKGARFLDHVHSCGTLEDALGVLGLIRRMNLKPDKITVVTSKFHKPRAELIFSQLFPFFDLEFRTDEESGTVAQKMHEARAIKALTTTLPSIDVLSDDLEQPIAQLSEELRHYDRLSYLALAASFLTVYAWINMFPSTLGSAAKLTSTAIMLVLSVLLFLIYYRLAGTAASARRTIGAVSFVLRRPHLGSSTNTASLRSPRIVTAAALSLAVAWLGAILVAYCSLNSLIPFAQQIHAAVCR